MLCALRPDQDANRPQLQLQLGHQRVRRRVFVFIRELTRPEGAGGDGHVDVKPAVRPELLPAHGLDLRIRRFNPSRRVVPQRLERGFNLTARRFRHVERLVDGPVVHDVDAKHHPGFDGVLVGVHANLHGGVSSGWSRVALSPRAGSARIEHERRRRLVVFFHDEGLPRRLVVFFHDEELPRVFVFILVRLVPNRDALARGRRLASFFPVGLVRSPLA